ncbi:MAG: hypothetical protein J0L70_10055 [Leptolyngbya sp. UWPOB_LEPTO1]|uniref:polysialyltransferase family glycosyltransferase n=1 Tax=Leptolyngbya sp. UWPOB_LEPTO1 TaxID=2815653 RepID=UPI001AD46F09|nr:polysialyltransferase family glycosyltransferase [Leptolyngbya sp. UWPOB_LEPTO1]MBN8560856.1 hypothetical protein [Leptolyngbya sp. UWPOB_LEPTO1]
MKRIITCQGSIQLIAALSALLHRGQLRDSQNYLVIYELYAPEQQHYEFATFIEQMARSICEWEAIVYLTPDQLNAIGHKLDSTRPAQIYSQVHRWLGLDRADEIYLCRNWQLTNQLLLNAYPSAYRVCYGDGIGLYFSEHSAVVRRPFTPPPTRDQIFDWTWWKLRSLWHRIRERLKLKTKLYSLPFDIGYFVLPDIFGETPPMPSVKLAPVQLLNLFEQFTSFVDDDRVAEIQSIIQDSPVSILLTSNFSEGERLPQAREIHAYYEFLSSHSIPSDSVLIIKPHPRDDPNKIKELQKLCSHLYREVILLTDSNLFFLPFEIFFLKAFTQKKQNIRIFAVSSAFLSLQLLFDLPSFIGFGADLTTQSFYPDFVDARLEHEQTLHEACYRLQSALNSQQDVL